MNKTELMSKLTAMRCRLLSDVNNRAYTNADFKSISHDEVTALSLSLKRIDHNFDEELKIILLIVLAERLCEACWNSDQLLREIFCEIEQNFLLTAACTSLSDLLERDHPLRDATLDRLAREVSPQQFVSNPAPAVALAHLCWHVRRSFDTCIHMMVPVVLVLLDNHEARHQLCALTTARHLVEAVPRALLRQQSRLLVLTDAVYRLMTYSETETKLVAFRLYLQCLVRMDSDRVAGLNKYMHALLLALGTDPTALFGDYLQLIESTLATVSDPALSCWFRLINDTIIHRLTSTALDTQPQCLLSLNSYCSALIESNPFGRLVHHRHAIQFIILFQLNAFTRITSWDNVSADLVEAEICRLLRVSLEFFGEKMRTDLDEIINDPSLKLAEDFYRIIKRSLTSSTVECV